MFQKDMLFFPVRSKVKVNYRPSPRRLAMIQKRTISLTFAIPLHRRHFIYFILSLFNENEALKKNKKKNAGCFVYQRQ